MPRVAVVFHSPFGHTRELALRLAKGAAETPAATADLIPLEDLPPLPAGPTPDKPTAPAWDTLDAADAIVLGCPTYMGNVTAAMKAFMDSTSQIWFEQRWKDKLAAGFTNAAGAAGNKENTLQTLITFAAQHGMHWITPGIMPSEIDKNAPAPNLNRLGAWLGVHAQSTNAPPSESPPEGDKLTAELFGARIAKAAARWTAGAQNTPE